MLSRVAVTLTDGALTTDVDTVGAGALAQLAGLNRLAYNSKFYLAMSRELTTSRTMVLPSSWTTSTPMRVGRVLAMAPMAAREARRRVVVCMMKIGVKNVVKSLFDCLSCEFVDDDSF